jgi:hypothetical protein
VNLMLPANLIRNVYPDRQPVLGSIPKRAAFRNISYVVEVKEKAETVPAKEKPIERRLYTGHPAESPEDAENGVYRGNADTATAAGA